MPVPDRRTWALITPSAVPRELDTAPYLTLVRTLGKVVQLCSKVPSLLAGYDALTNCMQLRQLPAQTCSPTLAREQ